MVLMIDNYDSFTFNIAQYLKELGASVDVIKNDATSPPLGAKTMHDHLVISPGPGTPFQAGISIDMIEKYAGEIPILGVCLGHQCIGQFFGGEVRQSRDIMHGKTSQIYHNGSGVFEGLDNPFKAMRYHSLILDRACVPSSIEVSAWTQTADGKVDEIMGIKHKTMAIYGIQFHPESILSDHGHQLLNNFLQSKQTST